MSTDPEEVRAILKWDAPSATKGVRGLVGFANYYRMFIPGFSEVVAPKKELTGKNVPFKWTNRQQHALEHLKQLFV